MVFREYRPYVCLLLAENFTASAPIMNADVILKSNISKKIFIGIVAAASGCLIILLILLYHYRTGSFCVSRYSTNKPIIPELGKHVLMRANGTIIQQNHSSIRRGSSKEIFV